MTGRRLDEVMAARAAALARPLEQDEGQDTVAVVTVEVAGGASFAIEARHVREVQRNEHLRRLPANTGALLGVVPTHGVAVPVADLGALLGLCEPSRTRPMVVVLDGEGAHLGLLVDRVVEVSAWQRGKLRMVQPLSTLAGDVNTRVGPHHTVVLDCEALLNDARVSASSRPGVVRAQKTE